MSAVPVTIYQVMPDPDTWVRLAVIEAQTGVPASTLRVACENKKLPAVQLSKAWHTTLRFYNEWIEAEGKRGGDAREATFGAVESVHPQRGTQDKRVRPDKSPGSPKPRGKGGRRKNKELRIVYDVSPVVAKEP